MPSIIYKISKKVSNQKKGPKLITQSETTLATMVSRETVSEYLRTICVPTILKTVSPNQNPVDVVDDIIIIMKD